MNRRWLVLGTCVALSGAATPVSAQSPATGSLEVMTEDASGAPLGEVYVQLTPVTGGPQRMGITDRTGLFAARLLTPGIYSALVERLGYQPVRVEGVPVQAGRTLAISVLLESVEGAVEAPRVVPYRGTVSTASRPGAGRVFGRREIATAPDRDRLTGEVLILSSLGEDDLAVEGLPGRLGGLVVDGVLHGVAEHHGSRRDPLRSLLYSLDGPVQLELAAGRPDLQWPTTAGALLSGVTAPGPAGGSGISGGAHGAWESAGLGDSGLEGHGGFRGGFALGSALMNDSARVRVYGSAITRDEPFRLWADAATQSASAPWLLEALELDPQQVPQRAVAAARTMHLGGRFDWSYGEDRTLELTTHYGTADREQAARSIVPGAAPATVDGSDLLATGATTSRLGERWNLEVRGGFGRSVRDYAPREESGRLASGAAVLLSDARLQGGADPTHGGRFERSDIRAAGTVQMDADAYLLQAGLGGAFSRHDRRYGYGQHGVYAFGDTVDLAALSGSFLRLEGSEPSASFATQRFHGFVQNSWRAAAGLDVRTGVRYDMELLPTGDILAATPWLDLTGIDNTAAPDRISSLGLVIAFDWDVQQRREWLVRGDVTVHGGELPPELLAEALTFDGRQTVRRAIGQFSGLEGDEAGTAYRRLTVLSPDLEAPVTTRGSLGVARALGERTTILVGAAIRRTEFLPVRTDLNLATHPLAVDQHGRQIFGVPRLLGSLIVPEPGTNRRFRDYDVVSAISSTGTSDYYGITLGIERRGSALDLVGSYTFSSTTDDWVGAAAGYEGAHLSPFPTDEVVRDWNRATSDFDVPHRLVLMADMAVPGLPNVRVGGLFRRASGRPFTPGYGPGPDLSGRGVAGSDPAFIDEALDGMDELLRQWDCLRENMGRFIARNACRAPDRTALDLRLEAGFLRQPGFRADLVIEALHVLASGYGRTDTALLLVDTEAEADLDIADGTVTFPVRVNPGFGSELLESSRAFQLRAGFQLRF